MVVQHECLIPKLVNIFSIIENVSELYTMAWTDAIIAVSELSDEKSIRAQQSSIGGQSTGILSTEEINNSAH